MQVLLITTRHLMRENLHCQISEGIIKSRLIKRLLRPEQVLLITTRHLMRENLHRQISEGIIASRLIKRLLRPSAQSTLGKQQLDSLVHVHSVGSLFYAGEMITPM
jgi:hypothetical protein